jgi:hypothetical protein
MENKSTILPETRELETNTEVLHEKLKTQMNEIESLKNQLFSLGDENIKKHQDLYTEMIELKKKYEIQQTEIQKFREEVGELKKQAWMEKIETWLKIGLEFLRSLAKFIETIKQKSYLQPM